MLTTGHIRACIRNAPDANLKRMVATGDKFGRANNPLVVKARNELRRRNSGDRK